MNKKEFKIDYCSPSAKQSFLFNYYKCMGKNNIFNLILKIPYIFSNGEKVSDIGCQHIDSGFDQKFFNFNSFKNKKIPFNFFN